MQNLYRNFLHENVYTKLNYSNKAVIYVNYMEIFLHENFYHENYLHENKAIYGNRVLPWKLFFLYF